MAPGHDQPLYLLPFDHRRSYERDMFGVEPPLTPAQHQQVVDSKWLIYEGFREALARVPVAGAGVLVDEEFGVDILRAARAEGYVTAVSTEQSGSPEFEFEYGESFAEHLSAIRPTFAKALVRYNPDGVTALNCRQTARLARLSARCRATGPRFMFELLVPATEEQLACVHGDLASYDRELRPALMVRAIRVLQNAGVEPDVWKVEGLWRREDCLQIVETARRDGRDDVGCIVLGRGAHEGEVVEWLEIAASVPGFVGFAVGRTTFWEAVAAHLAGRATRKEAVARIADRFCEWCAIFERARQPPVPIR